MRKLLFSPPSRLPSAPRAVLLSESVLPSQYFRGVRIVCFAVAFRTSFWSFTYFSEHRADAGKLGCCVGSFVGLQMTQWFWGWWDFPLGGCGMEMGWPLSDGPFSPKKALAFLGARLPMPLPWLSYSGSVTEPAQSLEGSWFLPNTIGC